MEVPERSEMRVIDAVLVFVNEEEHRGGAGRSNLAELADRLQYVLVVGRG